MLVLPAPVPGVCGAGHGGGGAAAGGWWLVACGRPNAEKS